MSPASAYGPPPGRGLKFLVAALAAALCALGLLAAVLFYVSPGRVPGLPPGAGLVSAADLRSGSFFFREPGDNVRAENLQPFSAFR